VDVVAQEALVAGPAAADAKPAAEREVSASKQLYTNAHQNVTGSHGALFFLV